MSLQPLLEKQTIRIDDHNRGSQEIKNWDNPTKDVHIDKRTKYKINGKIQSVTIRIPINSDREKNVRINGNKNSEIPYRLYKEIRDILNENAEIAEALAKDIADEIKDYNSILDNEQKVQSALDKISKHFNLEWTKEKISTYRDDKLIVYTNIYRNKNGKRFYFTLNQDFLELGDITGWSRHEIWLSRSR